MQRCWSLDPRDRPTFETILNWTARLFLGHNQDRAHINVCGWVSVFVYEKVTAGAKMRQSSATNQSHI